MMLFRILYFQLYYNSKEFKILKKFNINIENKISLLGGIQRKQK